MPVSTKSLARQRQAIRELTGPEQCFKPVTMLIGEINRQTTGWSHYFCKGYPSQGFRTINSYTLERLDPAPPTPQPTCLSTTTGCELVCRVHDTSGDRPFSGASKPPHYHAVPSGNCEAGSIG
jgi:hypothetical protein